MMEYLCQQHITTKLGHLQGWYGMWKRLKDMIYRTILRGLPQSVTTCLISLRTFDKLVSTVYLLPPLSKYVLLWMSIKDHLCRSFTIKMAHNNHYIQSAPQVSGIRWPSNDICSLQRNKTSPKKGTKHRYRYARPYFSTTATS